MKVFQLKLKLVLCGKCTLQIHLGSRYSLIRLESKCVHCACFVCLPLCNNLQYISDDEIKLQTYFFPLSAVFDVTAHVVVVP